MPKAVDPEAWADANSADLRYQGCRICDLGDELRDNVNKLWMKGFRRVSVCKYLAACGVSTARFTDQTFHKHFQGPAGEHGRS